MKVDNLGVCVYESGQLVWVAGGYGCLSVLWVLNLCSFEDIHLGFVEP